MDPAFDLVAIQRLHIRLLYCQRTVDSYTRDPDSLLRAMNLDAHWRKLLPDTTCVGHITEMRGRRIQAVTDLNRTFRATFDRIVGHRATVVAVADSAWFRDYLSSEQFFDPAWSLPHPTGIGRGYEGTSRFFFWLRIYFGLREPSCNPMLRDDVYLDFASELDALQATAVDPLWEWLKHGFYWQSHPGSMAQVRGLTSNRQVFTVYNSTANANELPNSNMLDLDMLEPVLQ